MKKLLIGLLLALALPLNALALEAPADTVVQNLDGSRQVVKTFTLAPDADAQELIEEPFELEGWLYTFADIAEEENRVEDSKYHTETVVVNTSTKDLAEILAQLASTMEYDDGVYSGTLALDHTTLHTEVAGYTSGSQTLTDTKILGPLDRNDMSYIPATTVKNGVTLSLSNVEWQVIGTDPVGGALAPSSYQAVATYSGTSAYRTATGYVTTAQYTGEISREGVESITYYVTYLGTELDNSSSTGTALTITGILPYVLGGIGLVVIVTLAVLLMRSHRAVRQLSGEEQEEREENEEEFIEP